MKTQSLVICILYAIGLRQCSAEAPLSLTGLYPPSPSVPGYYIPKEDSNGDSRINNYPSLFQQINENLLSAAPNPSSLLVAPDVTQLSGRSLFETFTSVISGINGTIADWIKKIIDVIGSIFNILTLPIVIVFEIGRVFLKLFFLPARIGWGVFKISLHVVQSIIVKLLPTPDPTPPLVLGISNPGSQFNPPVYAF